MPREMRNKDYTAQVLAEVADCPFATEKAIIRELCAIYDHFCDCPSVLEQKLYVRKRIDKYRVDILLRQNEHRNAKSPV